MSIDKQKEFYDRQYRDNKYAPFIKMEDHYYYPFLSQWIQRHPETKSMKWLEIGSGRGAMQDIVDDYTGVDVTSEAARYYHKKYVVGLAENLPFENNEYDVVWTSSVFEMIPEVEKALEEAIRVLKNRGVLLFAPAWHARPWAAKGYKVRSYSDFGLGGKIYKFFIPLMDSLLLRGIIMIPKRIIATIRFRIDKKSPLIYGKLKPEYKENWQSDVDACNSLDPFFTILWFEARGHKCITYKSFWEAFFSRNGPIEFQIVKDI